MSNTLRITYASFTDTTPQAELNALAACYRIILNSAQKRGRVLDNSGPDDGSKIKGDSANEHRST